MKSFLTYILLLVTVFPYWGFAGWKISSDPVKLSGVEGEIHMRPLWSSTGQWIAFTKVAYQGIWVINLQSGERKMLTDEQGSGFGFSWSNSGREIVCITTDYEGKKPFNQLKVFNVENNDSRTITDGKQRFRGLPRWTADDQKVYIMGRKAIHIFDTGLEDSAPNSTPEEKPMAYSKSGKIVVEALNQGTRNAFEPVSGMGILNLVISPDGTKLAFEVFGGNMHVMNIDGTSLTDLGVGYRPQWSPDSNYLVYMITEDDGHRFTSSDIYTIKIDGSDKTNLTNTNDILEMNPSWSPDGNQIAFDTYNEGIIYTVQIEK